MYGIVLFHTTSMSLKADKALKKAGLETRLIPTPRQYSTDCGFALRFDWGEEEQVRRLLSAAGVEDAGVHQVLEVLP